MRNPKEANVSRKREIAARSELTLEALAELGKRVRDARANERLSLSGLATRARVSIHTIIALEAAADDAAAAFSRRRRSIRRDVAVRLAHGLNKDPIEWVKLFGHVISQNETDTIINQVRRSHAGVFRNPESKPVAYFESVLQRLKNHNKPVPSIMFVSYTSMPRAAESSDVRQLITKCIRAGMWLAMTIPYPIGIRRSNITPLRDFYTEVFVSTLKLAMTLQQDLGKEYANRVALFVPKDNRHPTVPPLRLTEYRPALLSTADSNGESDRSYEFGVWLRLGEGAEDTWLQVYPIKGEDCAVKRAAETMRIWQIYFQDIEMAWCPLEKRGWDESLLQDWIRKNTN